MAQQQTATTVGSEYTITKILRSFMLTDEDGDVLCYRPTREEAEEEVKRWQGRDAISPKVEEFVDEMIAFGKQYDLDEDEVVKMIRQF